MKSKKFLVLIFISHITYAETSKVSKTVVESAEKTSYEKFSERLKINYFGFVTTPPYRDIRYGKWKNAAISPGLGTDAGEGHTNHDTWPTNIWNQISFNYNFGAKMNFIINPRFLVPLASPTSMKAPEDRSFISIEDLFTGFQGVVYSSANKKFNFFTRIGMRLPTSRLSRNSNNAGFGKTSQQLEWAYNPTYDVNKKWQISMMGIVRQWVYEDRYNFSRLRFYTAPYVQYSINDITRAVIYYENIIENNKRWKSINGKNPHYRDILQNVLLGSNRGSH